MRSLHLLLVVPLLACAGGDASRAALEANRLALEPELRIGSIDEPGTILTRVRDLAVAPDGRIYTLHRQEALLRVFDAEGEFVRTIGRRGEGPGEFDGLSSMGIIGDTLWVLDTGTYRFSFFTLDGELIRTLPVPIELGERGTIVSPPRARGLLSDGSIWGQPPAFSRLIADGSITELPILRIDSTMRPLDTLGIRPYRNTVWAVQNQGFGSYRSQPFSDTDLVLLSERAPEVVRVERPAASGPEPDGFRVTRLTFDGDTLVSRSYVYSPKPIDDALVERLVESVGESFENIPPQISGAPTPARAMEIAREALYRPDYHPPVTDAVLGRDGTIWLRREDVGRDSVDWNILAPDGEPIGVLTAAKRLNVLAVDRWTVWGMERGEMDVPYVVRYGVVRADGSDAIASPEEIGR